MEETTNKEPAKSDMGDAIAVGGQVTVTTKEVNVNDKESSGGDSRKDDDKYNKYDAFVEFLDLYDIIMDGPCRVPVKRGAMANKHAANAPYYLFYTAIEEIPETHNEKNSISFEELLDYSLGELTNSLILTSAVSFCWLLGHYLRAGYSHTEITLIHSRDYVFERFKTLFPNVITHLEKAPYGLHNTKMGILCYADGSLRVFVTSANMYMGDWGSKNQVVWLSPRCPELPPTQRATAGESRTGFKADLLKYLYGYQQNQLLAFYIDRVHKCDFSAINVFFVGSIPGIHKNLDWGLNKLSVLLRRHCPVPLKDNTDWGLIVQTTTIGAYGQDPDTWLKNHFLSKFCTTKRQFAETPMKDVKLRIIFPSLDYFEKCPEGLGAGYGLNYSDTEHEKQQHWLKYYMCQWKADGTHRTMAPPFIKSYMRTSSDDKMAAYYLVTSANLVRRAWGTKKPDSSYCTSNYEAGVLFIPEFVINEQYFPLDSGAPNRLPVTYDLPLTPYEDGMRPLTTTDLKKYMQEMLPEEKISKEDLPLAWWIHGRN